MTQPTDIAPATGKLGLLLVGLGAVSTTTIAGVMAIRKGLAQPIGSLTQMGTIRLGKRTEGRTPKINEFVPLAGLDDIVFGGWDIFEEDCYAAARTAGVLETSQLDQIRAELEAVKPMPAVFDQRYVKRLDGPNVKKGKNKRDLAEQLIADIRAFKAEARLRPAGDGVGGQHRGLHEGRPVHQTVATFEKGARRERRLDSVEHGLRLRGAARGIPFVNAAPNLTADIPAMLELAAKNKSPLAGNDMKTGQTLIKTIIAPGLKARLLGVRGWYSTNILGNRDGEVLDDPESFKTKEESKKIGARLHLPAAPLSRRSTATSRHVVRINYYPPRGDNKEGWDNIDLIGWLGYPMQLKINFLCRDSILAAPIVLDIGALHGPGEAGGHVGHPGVAVLLLQGADARAVGLSGARPVHPADEAEEHPAAHDGRRAHHPPGPRVLRLAALMRSQPRLGGLFIGVLSALPVVGAANCCCCLWIVVGRRAGGLPPGSIRRAAR